MNEGMGREPTGPEKLMVDEVIGRVGRRPATSVRVEEVDRARPGRLSRDNRSECFFRLPRARVAHDASTKGAILFYRWTLPALLLPITGVRAEAVRVALSALVHRQAQHVWVEGESVVSRWRDSILCEARRRKGVPIGRDVLMAVAGAGSCVACTMMREGLLYQEIQITLQRSQSGDVGELALSACI